MNILYGVQTTGNGHIVRAKMMLRELRARGHEVHAVLSGCPTKKVMGLEDFGSFERKKGLTFAVKDGRICYLKTARQLDFYTFYRDIKRFDAGAYDLVITDYEPITARIARRNKIPSIGIGHLYAFAHQVPVAGVNPLPKLIMNRYAPVDYPLGLHWHHFDQPILPPTVPDAVRLCRPFIHAEPYYLVYLPFENLKQVVSLLNQLPRRLFRVYANVDKPESRANVSISPFCRQGFIDDLCGCSGAICNAGFSFISEALHLGKKVLTRPLAGQVEQQSNGLALTRLGLGTTVTALTPMAIEGWIDTPAIDPLNFPEVTSLLVEWISTGRYDDSRLLIKQCWRRNDASLSAETHLLFATEYSDVFRVHNR
jgi:uncharacterized protein (TIGR00661 family)